MTGLGQRFAMLWWSLGAGVLLFMSPLFLLGHLVMTVRDHRRHGQWAVTGLALLWPLTCVAMAGVLDGNLSPPLFGIPLGLLASTAWMLRPGGFTFGVLAYFGLCSAVVLASVLGGDGKLRAGYLLFWPAALTMLLLWRKGRIESFDTEA